MHNGVQSCTWQALLAQGTGGITRPKKTESNFRFRFFRATEKPTKKSRFSVGKNREKSDRKKRLSVFGSQPWVYHTVPQALKLSTWSQPRYTAIAHQALLLVCSATDGASVCTLRHFVSTQEMPGRNQYMIPGIKRCNLLDAAHKGRAIQQRLYFIIHGGISVLHCSSYHQQ